MWVLFKCTSMRKINAEMVSERIFVTCYLSIRLFTHIRVYVYVAFLKFVGSKQRQLKYVENGSE